MAASLTRRHPRSVVVFLLFAAFLPLAIQTSAPADFPESLCHNSGGPGLPYWYTHDGGECKYEEHGVTWTCGATDPEFGGCVAYDVKKAWWRGGRANVPTITKWRLMYARLVRVRDGAIVWSIGWQPYQFNQGHAELTFNRDINIRIWERHAVTFKFEHVCVAPCTPFYTWGRRDLYPGA